MTEAEQHYRDNPEVVARVRLAQRAADGTAGLPEYRPRPHPMDYQVAAIHVYQATLAATATDASTAASLSGQYALLAQVYLPGGGAYPYDVLQRRQAQLIREIFGNPFRPVAIDPAWRTSDAVALARCIYNDRAFSVMPILADAIQDAGCENDVILSHCRTETIHARGCWVVDLVLDKT